MNWAVFYFLSLPHAKLKGNKVLSSAITHDLDLIAKWIVWFGSVSHCIGSDEAYVSVINNLFVGFLAIFSLLLFLCLKWATPFHFNSLPHETCEALSFMRLNKVIKIADLWFLHVESVGFALQAGGWVILFSYEYFNEFICFHTSTSVMHFLTVFITPMRQATSGPSLDSIGLCKW